MGSKMKNSSTSHSHSPLSLKDDNNGENENVASVGEAGEEESSSSEIKSATTSREEVERPQLMFNTHYHHQPSYPLHLLW